MTELGAANAAMLIGDNYTSVLAALGVPIAAAAGDDLRKKVDKLNQK